MKKTKKVLSMVLALSMVFSLVCTVTVGAEAVNKITADVTLIDGTAGMDKLVEGGYLSYRASSSNTKENETFTVDSDGYALIEAKHQLFTGQGSDGYWGKHPADKIIRPTYTYEFSGTAKTTATSNTQIKLFSTGSSKYDVTGDGVADWNSGNYLVTDGKSTDGINLVVVNNNEVSFAKKVTIYGYLDNNNALVNTEGYPANIGFRANNNNLYLKDFVVKQLDSPLYGELEITVATNNVITDMQTGTTAQLITKANGSKSGNRWYPVTRGSGVVYETSNAGVAMVNANGVVTAVGGGEAIITAKLYDKNDSTKYLASNEFKVTVKAPATPVVSATSKAYETNVSYTVNGAEKTAPHSIIVYGKVENGNGHTARGFKFTSEANEIIDYDMSVANVTADGAYAVRLVANELRPGAYSFMPYCVFGGNTITGNAVSETIAE